MRGRKGLRSLYQYTLNTLFFLAVAGSSVESLADATYYQWVDDSGAAVHSDRPPPEGVEYEIISTSSNLIKTVSFEDGLAPSAVDSPAGDSVNSEEASQSTKGLELCKRATTNLETLTNSDKVKVRNDEGEVRFLSPEEIEVQRQTAQAQIGVYCE